MLKGLLLKRCQLAGTLLPRQLYNLVRNQRQIATTKYISIQLEAVFGEVLTKDLGVLFFTHYSHAVANAIIFKA